MKSDIQIARETPLKKITEVASSIGISSDDLHTYGHYMAKVPVTLLDDEKIKKSNLILVTAITPTKAGIGKTTVSIGLALGLNRIGKKAIVALREPSLGPVFGMKGGAAGGGYSQVLPMENINLHFTGDFHAITSAHNTISALLDNYIYQSDSPKRLKEVVWKRVLDVNDRNLRYVVTGLNGATNGVTQESGFDITPASELMAILCLAENLEDLRRRIENITLAYTTEGEPFTVKDLGVAGGIGGQGVLAAMGEQGPRIMRAIPDSLLYPFANIAHGCNSLLATKMAMSHGEYAITEAGFGADLGAEKFFDIVCRKSGLQPKATVVVATAQGLKMHGDTPIDKIKEEDIEGLTKGLANLQKHIDNLSKFGQTIVVAFNRFPTDTDREIELVRKYCSDRGIRFAINEAFAEGGKGAEALARQLVDAVDKEPSKPLTFAYEDNDSVKVKIEKIAMNIYGARDVVFGDKAIKVLNKIKGTQLDHLPVCIAKTQFSFSADPKAYGVASGFRFKVTDLVVNSGAEFVVAIAGEIMRMPGLPKNPQARYIDIVDGQIEGLS